MEGTIAVIAGAVLLAMTAACGDAPLDDPRGDDPHRNAISDERIHMSLDCANELRSSATMEACDGEVLAADGTLPIRQLKHEVGYNLNPSSGTPPAITESEAIDAAHRFGISKDAQLRSAAVRSVYAPGYGTKFDHRDWWVLAFDVMVLKWGMSMPPGLNKPNPPVPGTAVALVNPQTGKVNRVFSW
ncbi:MAG TPA: hypothetical protein VEX15_21045 [Nocardioidaceae bacterium]|nr:hypothetical protein [Nocardioidaceae bacterium]